MCRTLIAVAAAALLAFVIGRTSAQSQDSGPEPSCRMCPAERVALEEIQAYERVADATGLTDQQIRSIDVGRTQVQIAFAKRGRLTTPRNVAEHDLVTEVYVVLDGAGTVLAGPDLVGKQRRPADYRAVKFLNGPGHNAESIRNGVTHELSAGDVLIIPAGTGHQFTRIEEHISYLMVRLDPDGVVPLLDASGSRAYLAENGQ